MSRTSPPGSAKTRRQVLKILAIGGAGGVAVGYGLLRRAPVSVSRSRALMGTVVNLTVVGDDREQCAAAVEGTLARMAELESQLSRHDPEAHVSRLNSAGTIDGAPDALLEVLDLAGQIHRLGDGAFDVTIQPVLDLYRGHAGASGQAPNGGDLESSIERVDQGAIIVDGRRVSMARQGMAITLDGIGKGYIADHAVLELKRRGFPDVLVDAGGDLAASGRKGEQEPWRLGIRHPRTASRLEARLDAEDVAVATSGDYMQPFTPDFKQHHIVDPRTGYSSAELASSTVLAPTAAMADGLATLTMVLDPRRGIDLLESLPGCEGYFVSKDLEVTMTTGFPVV